MGFTLTVGSFLSTFQDRFVGPAFTGQRGPRSFGLIECRQNAECLPKSPVSVSLDFC